MRRRFAASFAFIGVVAAGLLTGPLTTTAAAPGTGTWSPGASLAVGREQHTATLLPNGMILVAGGTDGKGKALATAELYDPKANRWRSAGSMMTARLNHTATLLPDGKVLVVGGFAEPGPSSTLASAELYDPSTNQWSPAAPMPVGRMGQTATLLRDGRVLIVGGFSYTVKQGGKFPNRLTSGDIYDPGTNSWTTTPPIPIESDTYTATLLSDGTALVLGATLSSLPSNSAEIYDPLHDKWNEVAPPLTNRFGSTAILLTNKEVLVVGGSDRQTQGSGGLTSAEVYDEYFNRWSTVAHMHQPHDMATATLLNDGRVLVVGGTFPSYPELYDPIRNAWSETGPLMMRYSHTATRLPDGRVVIMGGYGINALNTVLVYDPNAGVIAPRQAIDSRELGALAIALLLLVAGTITVPSVGRRVLGWRKSRQGDEWID